ncbi:MAG TPA: DUF488 family protein [Moheibacter sp.]|nr:DUF488 family protein [Moheibacter sp.]
MYTLKIKRIYEEATEEDGYRILVDRLWPRGISKEKAQLDEWLKDIAPSTELRKWFGHEAARAKEFARRYQLELKEKTAELSHILSVLEKQNVTLLFAAKTAELSQAIILQEMLNHAIAKK